MAWLGRRRESADTDYRLARQAVHALTGPLLSHYADQYLTTTRRRLRLRLRLRRADTAIDLWTLGGRRWPQGVPPQTSGLPASSEPPVGIEPTTYSLRVSSSDR